MLTSFEQLATSLCGTIRQMLDVASAERDPQLPASQAELLERWCQHATQMLEATEALVAAQPAPPCLESPPPESTPSQEVLRLLIAEDTDFSFELLRRFLHDQPHQIVRAYDGEQAIERACSGEIDLVLMDVRMPVVDGYEATRQIRAWESANGHERMPIVLVSGEDAARQMRFGGDAGCSGFLTKPVSKAQLLTVLKLYGRGPIPRTS